MQCSLRMLYSVLYYHSLGKSRHPQFQNPTKRTHNHPIDRKLSEPNALAFHSGFGQYFWTHFGATLSDIVLQSILSIISLFHLALPSKVYQHKYFNAQPGMFPTISACLRAPISIHSFTSKLNPESPHSDPLSIPFPISIFSPFQLLNFNIPCCVSSGASLIASRFSSQSILQQSWQSWSLQKLFRF
jgi:hypothetical protein